MKVEQIRKVVDGALSQLSESLDQGQSQTLKLYLAAMGRFHRYSLRNALLIAAQRPDARHVAGFHAWRRLGRTVRKGERGIAILAPLVRRRPTAAEESEDEASSGEQSVEKKEPIEEVLIAFRGAYVFDISQTEGRPLPEFSRPSGDPGVYLERLKIFVQQRNIVLISAEHLGGAEGASTGGRILIRVGLGPAWSNDHKPRASRGPARGSYIPAYR